MKQPEALRIVNNRHNAHMLSWQANACAELVRLHEANQEMIRYLPVLERAESDTELWARLTDGLGIATLNGYRAAIAKGEKA